MAVGKYAIAICDRCGFKFNWRDLTTEPGTYFKVCSKCNDGIYSMVCHPQNNVKQIRADNITLAWTRPDVSMIIPEMNKVNYGKITDPAIAFEADGEVIFERALEFDDGTV